MECGMSPYRRRIIPDLTLRAAGLVFLAVGALALRQVYFLVHEPPIHEASMIEMAIAAVGFLSLSAGSMLMAMGAHIFDQVEISKRWASLAQSPPKGESGPATPILLVIPDDDEPGIVHPLPAAREVRQFAAQLPEPSRFHGHCPKL
jgi:hypothetical protein